MRNLEITDNCMPVSADFPDVWTRQIQLLCKKNVTLAHFPLLSYLVAYRPSAQIGKTLR